MTADERYMARALQLARQGEGHVSPNPMVGAVIVARGRIIGEGFHRRYGEGHAEVNAIASVAPADAPLLHESTVYVTLEPCSHYGKTPPCARLLIERGVRRVVVGTLDPFEKVAGRGVAMLREAGIEVLTGVLERECRHLNIRFITAHTRRRPWVMLKWAQDANGYMGDGDRRVTFSTPETLRLMHRERSRVDAIMVGARTVALDNPSLDTRYWSGRSPLRVVLDEHLSIMHIQPAPKLLTDGRPTLVYNAIRSDTSGAVEFVRLDNCHDLDAILADLYSRGITSLMVEGGPTVLRAFIDANLDDRRRIETANAS